MRQQREANGVLPRFEIASSLNPLIMLQPFDRVKNAMVCSQHEARIIKMIVTQHMRCIMCCEVRFFGCQFASRHARSGTSLPFASPYGMFRTAVSHDHPQFRSESCARPSKALQQDPARRENKQLCSDKLLDNLRKDLRYTTGGILA